MCFDSRSDPGRFLVAVRRVSGARTSSELNAFVPVVTVALGSTPGTVLEAGVSRAEGVLR